MTQIIKYNMTQFLQKQFIHVKGKFIEEIFGDIIRDTKETFICYDLSFVLLEAQRVLETVGVPRKHAHKETE